MARTGREFFGVLSGEEPGSKCCRHFGRLVEYHVQRRLRDFRSIGASEPKARFFGHGIGAPKGGSVSTASAADREISIAVVRRGHSPSRPCPDPSLRHALRELAGWHGRRNGSAHPDVRGAREWRPRGAQSRHRP